MDMLDRELAVSGAGKGTVDFPERNRYAVEDTVSYKARHLSKASKGFHAGFALKRWGSVRMENGSEKESS